VDQRQRRVGPRGGRKKCHPAMETVGWHGMCHGLSWS
jgi:hypothetical protein